MRSAFDVDETPFVRTEFSDDAAWRELAQAATAISPEGFQAYFNIIDNKAFDGAGLEQLTQLASHPRYHAALFVADTVRDLPGPKPSEADVPTPASKQSYW